jgi:hypothetical protein
MFSSKSIGLFIFSAILVVIAYVCMAVDPAPSGFGTLTLWVAPPMLLLGFILPMAGIIGSENIPKPSIVFKSFTYKHAFGALAFCIAFTIYIITLEPTASLWDCAEFIASAYKLEVPHTPGTPLTLLFGRAFSMLAVDVHHVAWMVNMMSAFFSALSVVMVYLIIYFFGERLISPNDTWRKPLLILGSTCGSLCLSFSDTFWFSAVEAETYGIACFFLLMLVWMMLQGVACDEPLRSRIFVLVGYISGLAYCIHPMCLLVLPMLPFVWFVNEKAITLKAILVSVITGSALVFIINRFVAIGIFDLAFNVDRIAVNTFGLPFYSGVIILVALIASSFYFLLKKFSNYKIYTWAVIFLCLGFTPYVMLFIRSNQNPPIDETNPEELYQIKAYVNRDSYGSSPLLFGPYFDARIENVTAKNKAYYKGDVDYKIAGTKIEYQFEKSRETILPRIYSRDPNHIAAYQQWLGLQTNEKPGFRHNLEFMFTYQLGHMYLRYLLWNFVGRESDIQNSAWLKPWDRLSNGHSERARNQYWMIPLVFGIVGAWAQFRKDKKGFITNTIFFLFTGLILALYLNSPPVEPRERDYIYVASYIAFSIWIGLGVIAIRQSSIRAKVQLIVIIIISVTLPLWMLYQNYDDHDRSGRTFQIDYAKSVLNSCAPNAVLFTGGDNDTFPLWYLQEVEGLRTDVRVMVLSYMNTDWYINQLRRPYYQSPPFRFTLREKDYRQYGLNDILYLDDKIKAGIEVDQYLQLLKAEHPALRMASSDGDFYHIVPSRTLKLKSKNKSSAELSIELTGNFLEKNALAIIDLVASNEWKRPVYFNFSSMNGLSINLKPYLIQEGLVFRLNDDRTEKGVAVNTELAYKNMIDSADFSNLADARVNFNYEDFQARMIVPLRQSFNALAESCIMEGNNVMAEKVLMTSVEKLHYPHLLPSYTDLHTADMLMELGKEDIAKALMMPAFDYYYEQVKLGVKQNNAPDNFDLYILRQSTGLLSNLGETSYVNKFDALGL